MNRWRTEYAPGAPFGLGETGNARSSGEPGVPDVCISGLWWLDQLGLMARAGYQAVVRQSLTGADYGLLDEQALTPRPDYWHSLLWKRPMATQVYMAHVRGENSARLRVYAHRAASREPGSLSVLIINLEHLRAAAIRFPQFCDRNYTVSAVNTPYVLGTQVLLNGGALNLRAGAALSDLTGMWYSAAGAPVLTVHPLSYACTVFPPR